MNKNAGADVLIPLKKDSQEKAQAEATKVIQGATKSVDVSGVASAARKLKDRMVTRSIKYTDENYKKMCVVKDKKGPDFIWQVNRALELWFEKEHADLFKG
ncbi:MAG: hypothetical protein PHC61_00695 [Chitinivibrionales bacterium]|nr:hypothetical protein [Chitinivibrionales bacterium]